MVLLQQTFSQSVQTKEEGPINQSARQLIKTQTERSIKSSSERNLTLIIWTLRMPRIWELNRFQIEDEATSFLWNWCPMLFKMGSTNQSTFWKAIHSKCLQITPHNRESQQCNNSVHFVPFKFIRKHVTSRKTKALNDCKLQRSNYSSWRATMNWNCTSQIDFFLL